MASLGHNEWHICLSKLNIIGSDNGLLPGQRQAIIWTNAGILLIGPLGTNFSKIDRNSNISIEENSFENVVCGKAAILSPPQCVNTALYYAINISVTNLVGVPRPFLSSHIMAISHFEGQPTFLGLLTGVRHRVLVNRHLERWEN